MSQECVMALSVDAVGALAADEAASAGVMPVGAAAASVMPAGAVLASVMLAGVAAAAAAKTATASAWAVSSSQIAMALRLSVASDVHGRSAATSSGPTRVRISAASWSVPRVASSTRKRSGSLAARAR